MTHHERHRARLVGARRAVRGTVDFSAAASPRTRPPSPPSWSSPGLPGAPRGCGSPRLRVPGHRRRARRLRGVFLGLRTAGRLPGGCQLPSPPPGDHKPRRFGLRRLPVRRHPSRPARGDHLPGPDDPRHPLAPSSSTPWRSPWQPAGARHPPADRLRAPRRTHGSPPSKITSPSPRPRRRAPSRRPPPMPALDSSGSNGSGRTIVATASAAGAHHPVGRPAPLSLTRAASH